MNNIRFAKQENSEEKLQKLGEKFSSAAEFDALHNLTIFVTGSYARLEASKHSDIDLFFITETNLDKEHEPKINSLRMFAKTVNICDELGFPKFSNDGEFLTILQKPMILKHLGDRSDDYENHFTARLLMILESRCVFGGNAYYAILEDILQAYFRDYPDHPKNFQPTFLVNDILRFWKTLCLNYENKRNQPKSDQVRKISQKIKNLKLKFSRKLTCFGSICYIVSQSGDISEEDIMKMSKMSPLQRLMAAAENFDSLQDKLEISVNEYDWFLKLTDVSEAELKNTFSHKHEREKAFSKAEIFGDAIYDITRTIADENDYLRFLLV